MNKNNFYKIYYNKNEYITEFLNKGDIINDCLTETKAFDIFFSDMILCNNYIINHFDNLEELVNPYNEEYEDYIEEYQYFIVQPYHNEDITIKATKKMGNTLYYDLENNIYIMGVTDYGTSRNLITTDLKVEKVEKNV